MSVTTEVRDTHGKGGTHLSTTPLLPEPNLDLNLDPL